ncbi:MAG: glycosyltransferase [Anaerolineae bacterium]
MMGKGESPGAQSLTCVALVGTYPPPIGGVSIHIKRLKSKLDNVGICCTVYDLGTTQFKTTGVIPVPNICSWVLKCLFFSSGKSIVHYHGASWKQRAALVLLLKLCNVRTVFTFHSLREEIKDAGLLTRFCINFVLRYGDYFIVVGPHIRDKLLNWGALQEKVSIIPAFISPIDDELDSVRLPGFFHQIRKRHKFLITANAFRISFHNGVDLYGIDLSIELMKRLRESGFSDVGFVYVIPDVGDYAYYERMLKLVREYQLEECFHFYTQPVPYAAVIKLCDLFIRPTNTDGDALSVRESLMIGRPVIASDVCLRPDGTILFQSRDIKTLYERTCEVISNYNHYIDVLAGISQDDYGRKILDIYRSLLQH